DRGRRRRRRRARRPGEAGRQAPAPLPGPHHRGPDRGHPDRRRPRPELAGGRGPDRRRRSLTAFSGARPTIGPAMDILDHTAPPSLLVVADRVEARLERVFEVEIARWRKLSSDLEPPLESLRSLVMSGGKRLRPAFCYWGFIGAGGDPEDRDVIDAGAAFEMLQAFALVHDDVMDG